MADGIVVAVDGNPVRVGRVEHALLKRTPVVRVRDRHDRAGRDRNRQRRLRLKVEVRAGTRGAVALAEGAGH